MKYFKHKLIGFVMMAIAIMSCTDDYNCDLQVEKPEDVAFNEYLNQFDLLKSYVDRSTGFQLAANLPASEFVKKNNAYSTLLTNFDAVDIYGSFTPLNTLSVDEYDFGAMETVATTAAEAGVTLYGGALCSNQGQRTEYYNKLLEPIVIPFVPEKGSTVLFDFENDELGDTYEMTGNSTAVVEKDPTNESGNVLHVGTDDVKAAHSYPKLQVKLPEGRKLGDYVKMRLDLRFVGTDGIWGSGLRVYINTQEFTVGGNGDLFCGGGNKWKRDGVIKMNDSEVFGFVLPPSMKDLTEFELRIGSASGGAQYYLDNIIMDYEVAGGGLVSLFDFENDDIGKSYPMTNGSTAVVEEDPTGESGHVLHVGTDAVKAAYSFPKFNVVLPDGMTLGEFLYFYIDLRFVNNDGIWGSGMYVIINNNKFHLGGNGDVFCGGGNKWKREGVIKLHDAAQFGFVLPDELKGLTEFELSVGSESGGAQYYLDNIGLYWKSADKIIEKTPEEKVALITKEMEKWIGGMVYAGVNDISSVKTWNIVSEPLDKTVDANTFNWGDHLGEVEYVRTAMKIANDTVKNSNVNLEFFVSNTFNQYDEMGQKADELIALVNFWEADNVTKIDGYNILLHAVYSEDAMFQAGNEQVIAELFGRLAQTGKQIRISDLSMMVEDADGNFISSDKLTTVQRTAAAGYMAFIIKEYRKTIASDKQYGISISGITEATNDNKVCPWTSKYNRNEMYEGIVQGFE
ncbi:hypothetical protein LJB80_01435 [Bacteroides sp. OttesenSCG-928-F21]|nr:hypothetical protein [Bacteroides sp. OttesenSCG-928-F21]